jgi:hypothetical protein
MAKKADRFAPSRILYFVGLIGGIASILSFVRTLFVSQEWQMIYIAASSSLYILALIAICAYTIWDRGRLRGEMIAQQRPLARKARYTKVFHPLHSIYHRLRDTLVRLRQNPPEPGDVYDENFCRAILDLVRDIFQSTSGADCAACIKTFDNDEDSLKTICRDSASEIHRGSEDALRPCRVSDNMDFKEIVQGRKRYFFSNDLTEEVGYYNDNPDWQSRYRSTIVWPIRYFDEERGKHQLFGFLCVDSMATGIFDEELDVQVGACVADMIYTYFSAIDAANEVFGQDASGTPQKGA